MRKKITLEPPVRKCLAKQDPKYSLTFDLFSTFKFYFQHSSFIFIIQFFLLNVMLTIYK